MELNERSWLIWWAFLFSEETPDQVSLCALFWRCVLRTPLTLLIIGFVVSIIIATVIADFKLVATITGLFAGLILVLFLTCTVGDWVKDWRRGYRYLPLEEQPILMRGYKAIKGKYCPIIRIR